MKTQISRYDVAEHRRTPEEIAAYLEACFQESNGDAVFIDAALDDIASAKDMMQIAQDKGLSMESVYNKGSIRRYMESNF